MTVTVPFIDDVCLYVPCFYHTLGFHTEAGNNQSEFINFLSLSSKMWDIPPPRNSISEAEFVVPVNTTQW